MQYDLIPEDLKKLNRWGVYRIEEVDGRDTKVPYQPIAGNQRARVNDKSTWYSFDEANTALSLGDFDGLSFLLGDGIFGVDLDHAEEDLEHFECGEPIGIVYEFISQLDSYAEISPSGTGVHIICGGSLPEGGRRKGDVEMYDRARFFTITGDTIYQADIRDCTETIKPLHEKYIGKSKSGSTDLALRSDKISKEQEKEGDLIVQSLQNDELFRGNYERLGYSSQSEADLALCNKLAYKARWDVDIMDYVFRQSGLYREKWDRDDYANKTLSKAMDSKPTDLPQINIVGKRAFYGYDDTGNAQRFRDEFRGDVYYCPDFGKWTYYDSAKNKWCVDDLIVVKRMFDKVIENMAYEQASDPDALQKHIKATRASTKKRNALVEAQHLMPVKNYMFDTYEELFNLKNGYIDLTSNTFCQPDKNKLFMQVAGVDFNPDAKCDKWLKFLDEIFLGDQELIDYIQKVLGYSLSGNITEQIMLVFFGTGQNGKSIFTEVLRELLGDYSANMDIKSLMVRGNNAGSSDIARLKGKRFVSTSENNEGSRLDEGLVKQLTGGDVITARHLYQSEIEFTPQCTICMTTNHKPIIRGTDDGIWRRIVLIPFRYKVPQDKIDRKLKQKLLDELPGIFNWMLEGNRKYRQEGLELPEVCKRETEEYKLEMDPIARFIDERCVVGNNNITIKASDLYLNYKSWAEVNNEYVMNSTRFGREISKRFYKEKQRTGIFYIGIGIDFSE